MLKNRSGDPDNMEIILSDIFRKVNITTFNNMYAFQERNLAILYY